LNSIGHLPSAQKLFEGNSDIHVIEGDATGGYRGYWRAMRWTTWSYLLDGHYSAGITACGDVPEPACIEVEIAAEYKEKIRGIIIDDFRTFGVGKDFPSKSELMRTIERHFPEDAYVVQVHLDAVIVTAR
jgi:hypothetical protein